MSTHTFYYRRVSSIQQSYERQTAAFEEQLRAAGIPEAKWDDFIFGDKLSGKTMDRPGLKALRKVARDGDTIVVTSLDRLGRTVLHMLQTFEELENEGITVKSLKGGEQFEGITGQLLRNIMLSIAEWERQVIAERSADARAARAAKGVKLARKPTALTPGAIAEVRMLAGQNVSKAQIARTTKLSRASVYRALC